MNIEFCGQGISNEQKQNTNTYKISQYPFSGMGNGQWAIGNGQWAMGSEQSVSNGQWGMGNEQGEMGSDQ